MFYSTTRVYPNPLQLLGVNNQSVNPVLSRPRCSQEPRKEHCQVRLGRMPLKGRISGQTNLSLLINHTIKNNIIFLVLTKRPLIQMQLSSVPFQGKP